MAHLPENKEKIVISYWLNNKMTSPADDPYIFLQNNSGTVHYSLLDEDLFLLSEVFWEEWGECWMNVALLQLKTDYSSGRGNS